MGRLIERVGPFTMELKATPSIFVALAESIVYQQLHGRAAATIAVSAIVTSRVRVKEARSLCRGV